MITHELQRPMANIFAQFNEKLHEFAQEHVNSLCTELVSLDRQSKNRLSIFISHSCSAASPIVFSSYSVERPFGFPRLVLSEILSEIVVSVPTSLDKFPSVIWKVLGSWFLDYRYRFLPRNVTEYLRKREL